MDYGFDALDNSYGLYITLKLIKAILAEFWHRHVIA